MKKISRILIIALSAAMIVTAMAACNNNKPAETSTASSAVSAESSVSSTESKAESSKEESKAESSEESTAAKNSEEVSAESSAEVSTQTFEAADVTPIVELTESQVVPKGITAQSDDGQYIINVAFVQDTADQIAGFVYLTDAKGTAPVGQFYGTVISATDSDKDSSMTIYDETSETPIEAVLDAHTEEDGTITLTITNDGTTITGKGLEVTDTQVILTSAQNYAQLYAAAGGTSTAVIGTANDEVSPVQE